MLVYHTFFQQHQTRERHALLFLAFFVASTGLILLRLAGSILAPLVQLRGTFIEPVVIAGMLLLLVQFAYHFPGLPPRWKWESRLALSAGGLYLLAEAGYAFYRFFVLTQGEVTYRAPWFATGPVASFVWTLIMFARQTVRSSQQGSTAALPWPIRLWQPQNLQARTTRAFGGITLLLLAIFLTTLARASILPSSNLLHAALTTATLLSLFFWAMAYLNSRPETISFLVVLTGTVLVTLLIVLSIASWSMMGTFVQNYVAFLPNDQTLAYTPNRNGGYTVTATPRQTESYPAAPIDLTDQLTGSGYPTVALDFTFPFYGRTYRQLYITPNGAVGLGQPPAPWAIENYGSFGIQGVDKRSGDG